MPIYEYECRGCGHQFEFLLMHSSPKAECPACGGRKLDKKVSLCAVSSETTRNANLKAARKRSAVVQKDKQHEEHKAIHEHD
jgi:putative FmdB family regulatory protein